jgi:CubicO group peptidase (beta-lactamase class C family)
VAKTFTGCLLAIAMEEGYVKSLDEPVQKYLPDFPFDDVNSDHLVNHTSGLKFPAEWKMYYGKNLDRLATKVSRRAEPGVTWRYENGGSQLLGQVIKSATGIPLAEYLQSRIWDKIGTEAPLHWSTDGEEEVKAFCCMNARARDFARFGLVMQDFGSWQGEQIIPRWWFEQGTQASSEDGRFIRYRHQMWLENHETGTYLANGAYGQYIYVYPPKNIVIVRFAVESLHVHAAWSEFVNTVIEQL